MLDGNATVHIKTVCVFWQPAGFINRRSLQMKQVLVSKTHHQLSEFAPVFSRPNTNAAATIIVMLFVVAS
jgi:hypothetical protein